MIQVLRNSSGEVIKNKDGRALKANYNFGNSYTGAATIELVPDMSFADTTICFWTYLNKTGAMHIAYDSLNNELFRQSFLNGDTPLYTTYFGAHRYSGQQIGRIFHCIRISATRFVGLGNMSGQPVDEDTTLRAAIAYAKMIAGYGFSDYYAYDRYLSDTEVDFIYNKKVGNAPLSLSGCIVALECEKAEALDCSIAQDGSDIRAALRNAVVGKPHAALSGLPAGTTQEQVDYANANLFTTFK
jgi:hypothetical protein